LFNVPAAATNFGRPIDSIVKGAEESSRPANAFGVASTQFDRQAKQLPVKRNCIHIIFRRANNKRGLHCIDGSPCDMLPKTKLGTQPKKRGILIVDDHPLFRKGIVQLLSQEPDLEVRAEVSNSAAALGAIRREKFDLAVLDIALEGGANGIELTKSIKAERPNLPVLILSMHDEAL
jgi:PleD family two-component response regulator